MSDDNIPVGMPELSRWLEDGRALAVRLTEEAEATSRRRRELLRLARRITNLIVPTAVRPQHGGPRTPRKPKA